MPTAQNNSTSIQFFVDLCIVNPLIASNTTTMLSDVEKNQLLTEKKVYCTQNQTNVQKNKSCLGCQSAADLTAKQIKKRKVLQNKMSNKLSQ